MITGERAAKSPLVWGNPEGGFTLKKVEPTAFERAGHFPITGQLVALILYVRGTTSLVKELGHTLYSVSRFKRPSLTEEGKRGFADLGRAFVLSVPIFGNFACYLYDRRKYDAT